MERAELARRLGAAHAGSFTGPHRIDEADPHHFMAAFCRAAAGEGDVFLCDPAWRESERAQMASLGGDARCGERGWLMIPTGGSGGIVRFARHDAATIAAAVGGFCRHFGRERVNSVGVLPLHHVSGFMAWMRSALTGGTYIPWSWKEAQAGRFPGGQPADCFVSLVPTQLQALLRTEAGVAWLRRFQVIFLGGAPAWDALLDEAARLALPLSLGYGSTETAAMAAALTPEQFLGGARGCGTAMPHASIAVAGGLVQVAGDSVFRGYYPESRAERTWISGDLGSIDAAGNLTILGRADDVVITGGEKVFPSEVEAALKASGQFEDAVVIGLKDDRWGQVVVACHPAGKGAFDAASVNASLAGLAAYKRPKHYVAVEPWPRTPQGKVDRAALSLLARERVEPA